MPPSPGERVTPHVKLVERLAEGSMGSVWVADHLTLHTQVAVKFIAAPNGADDAELSQRFEREARAAARIKSHHVVQIFDYGVSSSGTPYMVLELLEGESLAARLAREGGLSLADTTTVVVHVTRALTKAHELGIVHRDIKPANIYLTSGEEGLFCKVLDFGIAKELPRKGASPDMVGEITLEGALVGTPEYMSPEQLLGRSVDHRADLWALAVVAYQCLTGRLPFTGKSIDALSRLVSGGGWTPPSSLREGLPVELDTLFAHAFHRKREERFTSADEIAAEFRRLTSSDATLSAPIAPASVPPASPPGTLSGSTTRRVRPRRIKRAWRAVGGVAALGAGAVVGLLVLAPSSPSPEPRELEAPAAPASAASPASNDVRSEITQTPIGTAATSNAPASTSAATKVRRAPQPVPASASDSVVRDSDEAAAKPAAQPSTTESNKERSKRRWGY